VKHNLLGGVDSIVIESRLNQSVSNCSSTRTSAALWRTRVNRMCTVSFYSAAWNADAV